MQSMGRGIKKQVKEMFPFVGLSITFMHMASGEHFAAE